MTIQPPPTPTKASTESNHAQPQTGSKLFTPITLGDIELKHRLVMAPMTRLRAGVEDGIPSEMAIEYYRQRATDGGLIISEATSPSEGGKAWSCVPGIYTEDQIAAWRKITDVVHSKGGKILNQICLVGRVATPGVNPVIWAPSNLHNPDPGAPKPELHVMTQADIDLAIEQFTDGAKNAIRAGFDGVEIHCANGYLLDQFIQSNSNIRTDSYGGSLANRFRFPLAVISSVSAAIGAKKVGVRISPFATFQGMREEAPLATFVPFVQAVLDAVPNLAFFHGLMPRADGAGDQKGSQLTEKDTFDPIREILEDRKVPFIVAGGFDGSDAKSHTAKYDDLVAFGRHYTSNPDLVSRIKNDYPLQKYDRSTFYTQDANGYTDWPDYKLVAQASDGFVVPVDAGSPVPVRA